MSTVTADIATSLDGYAADPNQSADPPFGEGVDGRLHTWMFDHAEDNRDEIDGIVNAGAYIMGRNMFGPGRASGISSGRDGGDPSRRITRRCTC
jgi:hypothetical protein